VPLVGINYFVPTKNLPVVADGQVFSSKKTKTVWFTKKTTLMGCEELKRFVADATDIWDIFLMMVQRQQAKDIA
jgi:hypothetical protein